MSPIKEATPLHALIVDDDEVFAHRLTKGLTEYGFEATSLRSVEDALAAIANKLPDVLLLCPFLTDGSGLQLIETLRSAGESCSTAIIGLAQSLDGPPKLIAQGCDTFIVKPCTAEQIVDRVDRLFGTKTAYAG